MDTCIVNGCESAKEPGKKFCKLHCDTLNLAQKVEVERAAKRSKAKHTPGPWAIHDRDDICQEDRIQITGLNGWIIARVGDGEKVFSLDEANARLIAAAPELLESTRELIDLLDEQLGPAVNPVILKALATIAKAEGR